MAEEFQAAGICGGNWWNSSKNVFPVVGSLPCSMSLNNDIGSYNNSWQTDILDLKSSGSCGDDDDEPNINSMIFQDINQKPIQKIDSSSNDSGGDSILIDSTLQMMGFGLSSSSTTSSSWNQSLIHGCETDLHSSSQIQKDWIPKRFSSSGGQVSSIDGLKAPMNQEFSNGISTSTCQGLSSAFSYGYPSTLINSLFDIPAAPPPEVSVFNNQSMSYSPTTNYGTEKNESSPTWSKLSPFIKPSMPKQQPSGLHFSNNTPFWNPSASASALNGIRAGISNSPQAQYIGSTFEKDEPNCSSTIITKPKNEEAQDSGAMVKKSSVSAEPAFKRPRIETPSPLPTFKVRKEKLGDRITALQQLVSPFGKTDTASVLHEAIEYIKFLHDQVSSTPYMKNGTHIQNQQQGCDNLKNSGEVPNKDLRSRGLCLVPISSTFPVANETTADFWTPTFGGTFR
ncbi:putative Transcription factor [Quillaja saponaria]|uniref:Transcription factor n=1 Tax=Quillaja saponaria TaxID=32244 RepID=A0AAD7KXE5_QUISA|nr:putative Transcription factor [Quillaja saponaria]